MEIEMAEISTEVDQMVERSRVEKREDWRRWVREVPSIEFPSGWKVKVIPPYAGAMVRFLVELPDGRKKSIYLDVFDALGCVGKPYWEVHPCNGDCDRCLMDDVAELITLIDGPS